MTMSHVARPTLPEVAKKRAESGCQGKNPHCHGTDHSSTAHEITVWPRKCQSPEDLKKMTMGIDVSAEYYSSHPALKPLNLIVQKSS